MKGLGAMGDLKKLRDEAMKIQNELKQIVVTASRGRVSVELTADMKVRSFKLNEEEMKDAIDALNEALEKAQKKAAAKMQEMGGGLSGLLGK
ncbi:MAG: YbaB/EbfC family nucleoid-associated protein [Candidatus Levyibacteriota bacterium]